jgi:hypothetical protein
LQGLTLRDIKTGREYFGKISFLIKSDIKDKSYVTVNTNHQIACFESMINQTLLGLPHLDVADHFCSTKEVIGKKTEIFERYKKLGANYLKKKFFKLNLKLEEVRVFLHMTLLMVPRAYQNCISVKTLGKCIKDGTFLSLPRILVQIIRTLIKLNEMDIKHNDIHTENIMIFFRADGEIYVRLFDYDCSYSSSYRYDYYDANNIMRSSKTNPKLGAFLCLKDGLCPDNNSRADVYRLLRSIFGTYKSVPRNFPEDFLSFLKTAFQNNSFEQEKSLRSEDVSLGENIRFQTIVKDEGKTPVAYENFLGYACDMSDRTKCTKLSDKKAENLVLSMEELLKTPYLKSLETYEPVAIDIRPACVYT